MCIFEVLKKVVPVQTMFSLWPSHVIYSIEATPVDGGYLSDWSSLSKQASKLGSRHKQTSRQANKQAHRQASK